MERINSLQALRGLAAIGVVLAHTMHDAAIYSSVPTVETIGLVGTVGVDVFFVISGFIMMATTGARPLSPSAFLLHRAIRVVPLYWCATMFQVVLAYLGRSVGKPDASELVRSLLFIPYSSDHGSPYLHVGWTLNYEMFFYALFSLALFWPARRSVIVCTLIALLVTAGSVTAGSSAIAASWTNPIMLEFCAGCLVANVWKRGFRPSIAVASCVGAVALIILALSPVLMPFGQFERVTLQGLPAAVLVTVVTCCPALERLARWRLLQLLGDASYSIYLFHTAVLIILGRVWASAGMPVLPVLILLPLVLSIAAGVACHQQLEKPLISGLRAMTRGRRQFVPP